MRTGNASGHITVLAVLSAAICLVVAVSCGPKPTPYAPAPVPPGAPVDAGTAQESREPADSAPAATDVAPTRLGMSPASAVQVCRPSGEAVYLENLRCLGGAAPSYARSRYGGYRNPRQGDEDYRRSADQVRTGRPLEPDEIDLHPVDLYTVQCRDEQTVQRIYLDMYHCGDGEQTADAPPGFTIVAEK